MFFDSIVQFEALILDKKFKNWKWAVLVFIASPNFNKFTKKWIFKTPTFPFEILKPGKSLINLFYMAPWAPILVEKYQNLSLAAYDWKCLLLSRTPCMFNSSHILFSGPYDFIYKLRWQQRWVRGFSKCQLYLISL